MNAVIVAMAFVDDEGYLVQPETWDREVAQLLARNIGVNRLSWEHWCVIMYLRRYYLEFGIVPPVGKLCRDTGFRMKEIYKLFPEGLHICACKIAGIPTDAFRKTAACLYP